MMKFNYKGKEYQIEDPTIEMWSKLVLIQDWTEEKEFAIKVIALATGLDESEVENADYEEVLKVANELSVFLLNTSKDFQNEIEFQDKKYRFLDLTNLTFGEFIDLDSYLSKEPHEKKRDMHMLMAMLYRETDENGNYLPYNSKDLQKKGELFKKLPVRYVNGASSFFLRIDKISSGNFKLSSVQRWKLTLKMIWIGVRSVVLINIGLGLARLSHLRTKISQKLTK